MKRKKLLTLLLVLVTAVIVRSGVAISGTTYTWEETFEVTKPKIECEIEISDCRVVGCPVKICVKLKLEDNCGRCWLDFKKDWDAKCNDDWEDKRCYSISGTYSVQLYWWNGTQEDWHHLMYLQEEVNITLIGWKNIDTACRLFTFTPKMEGEYKVVVTFATDIETLSFSSED